MIAALILYVLGWALVRGILIDETPNYRETKQERDTIFWAPLIWPLLALMWFKDAFR